MEKSDHINYEELYPTVDDRPDQTNYGATYPQVVPVTEHKDADSRYPMAVENPTLYNSPPPLPGSEHSPVQTPTSLMKNESIEEVPLPPRSGKILGLRRRTFWIVCGILLVIVIGAAVGGGVAGSKTSKKSSTSSNAGAGAVNGGSSSSSATSTSPVMTSATALGVATATVSSSVPTGSAINIHAIAASVVIGGSLNYTSIAYQNTSSWEISYRFNSGNGSYSAPKIMSLPLTPIEQTPLAATSNTEDLGIALNVFYIDNLHQICNVNITCPFDSSYDCFIRNVSQISTNLSTPISSQTSLAAEYLGSTLGWRVFYQDENNMMSVTSSIPGTTPWAPWDEGTVIGTETLSGSAIASSLEQMSGNMTVFYVGSEGGVIEMAEWDGEDGKWLEATQFTAKTAPNFLSTTGALTAASQAGTDVESRLYYLGTNKQIYEYTSSSTSNQWTSSPDQSTTWAQADTEDARLAVIGWNDEVRIYYQSGGEVVENVLSGGVWEAVQGV